MNILEISFKGIQDKRYRCLVSFVRSDRPRYWNFLCNNCGSKVCELQNAEVIDISDFYDPANLNYAGPVRHCKGTQPDGLACPYTYFFNLH